jgi:hypothetical protein
MRRRLLLALLIGTVITSIAPLTLAVAADRGEPPRIAILLYGSLLQHGEPEHPLLLGLRDVGLIDAKTATILVREAEGRPERLPQLAAELVCKIRTLSSPRARSQSRRSKMRPPRSRLSWRSYPIQ